MRVVGGAHSPSDIACTDGYMISLNNFKAVLEVNDELETNFNTCYTVLTINLCTIVSVTCSFISNSCSFLLSSEEIRKISGLQ